MPISKETISQEDGSVKQRYSTVEDSEGGHPYTEQPDYFNNSVVRDEFGRLMVMNHGTPNAGFTEFRSGTYFTHARDYADVYQHPGASSLSYKQQTNKYITKPFDTRNETERQIFDQEYYRKWGTGAPLSDRGLPDWTANGFPPNQTVRICLPVRTKSSYFLS
ncbi:MAG: hypothetical protein J6P31_02565 [Oscillospiraceae bacterium]|nr:hypothetical protein [Oscillospiraceae bacterium]